MEKKMENEMETLNPYLFSQVEPVFRSAPASARLGHLAKLWHLLHTLHGPTLPSILGYKIVVILLKPAYFPEPSTLCALTLTKA